MNEKKFNDLYENALKAAAQPSDPPKISYEFVRSSVIEMYKQIHAGLFIPLDQHSGGNPGALERQKRR
jgi:hypothetical protein